MKRILFALALCGIFGCSSPPPRWEIQSETTVGVTRVFMNSPNEYIIFTQVGNQLVPKTYEGFIKVYTDVAADKPMYAIVRRVKQMEEHACCPNYYGIEKWSLDIHVHNPECIGGGQWSKTTSTDPLRVEHGQVIPIK